MFTEQDYRDQLGHKRVCSCGMCDTCDAWSGVTTQDLLATIFEKSVADAADDEDRLTMRQAAATLDARCGEGTAARYGFRDVVVVPRLPIKRCADCGEPGVLTGHQECQYPQDHD